MTPESVLIEQAIRIKEAVEEAVVAVYEAEIALQWLMADTELSDD